MNRLKEMQPSLISIVYVCAFPSTKQFPFIVSPARKIITIIMLQPVKFNQLRCGCTVVRTVASQQVGVEL